MDKRDILMDAMSFALEIEKRGGHLFVDYSPHVDKLDMRYFKTGWKRKTSEDPDQTHEIWFEHGGVENKWNEIKGKILYKN